MNDTQKTVLISLTFFLFFFALGTYSLFTYGEVNGGNDFSFHYLKVNDLSYGSFYPQGYHEIFQVFKSSPLLFYVGNLILICFMIPIALLLLTKTWWSSLIYFCGISLPHLLIYGATYPQALTFLLLIVYFLNRKNALVFVLCALLAGTIHNQGFALFALVLIAEIVDYLLKTLLKKKLGAIFKFSSLPASGFAMLGIQKFPTKWHTLFFLFTQTSIAVYWLARKIIFQPFYLILATVPLFALNSDPRIIGLTELVLLIVASQELPKARYKKIIIALLLIQLAFFLLEFSLGTINLIQIS